MKTESREGRRPSDNRGRDWRDAPASQEHHGLTAKRGRGKEGIYPESQSDPANTLISNFEPPEV